MTQILTAETLDAYVLRATLAAEAIDVHTHILPPTHGALMLYGIDELLTYHYLVAELFMVLPLDAVDGDADSVRLPGAPPGTEEFFAWPKERQAELIFEELFVKRTPLSEACCGVVSVLQELGLGAMLREAAGAGATPGARLGPLRAWFAAKEPAAYVEEIFRLARLRYAVMTNIPFAPAEAEHWPAAPGGAAPEVHARLRPALRVDPLLVGDWAAVRSALGTAYAPTVDGCVQWVRDWCARMQPVYLMASTPHGFKYEPGAGGGAGSGGGEPTGGALLEGVLLRVARELKLPVALKVGAVRGANPAVRLAGDAVEVADLSFLRALCARHRDVKFLVTVLSKENQHELCVLARKFGNLHVYGCWWFCNNPSIIDATTRMRLEMLGTAFTCQHSDARVLEQLLYKWKHSRKAVAPALAAQYRRLLDAGWELTEADVTRDLELLFGGAYEAFLAK